MVLVEMAQKTYQIEICIQQEDLSATPRMDLPETKYLAFLKNFQLLAATNNYRMALYSNRTLYLIGGHLKFSIQKMMLSTNCLQSRNNLIDEQYRRG